MKYLTNPFEPISVSIALIVITSAPIVAFSGILIV